VQKLLALVFALIAVVAAASAALSAAPKPAPNKSTVDFAANQAVIDLGGDLTLYKSQSGKEPDGSIWYMMTVVNPASKPATRVLQAEEPTGAGLELFPLRGRAAVLQVASSEAGVTVERVRALGKRAFSVQVPAATTVAIAMRLANAGEQPVVLAWTEAALVAHNRSISIFIATVAGLIGAALAIMVGLAVMTGHDVPRWAALTIAGIFLSRLASTGMLDTNWITVVGGPYGLSAMLAGLSLAAGARLADTIVPVETLWPQAARWKRLAYMALVGLSILAFLGLPGATVLVDILVVFGSGAVAVYVVHRGRLGSQAARVASPAAAVFALVTLAAAIAALGGFEDNPAAPAMIGGFAAAGAVLLALAVAAGEGIAILPAMRVKAAVQAPPKPPEPVAAKPAPVSPAALLAIGASHQGVFELDFRKDMVKLSTEAAALIGFPEGPQTMPHANWIARVHPEDRDVYEAALGDYRAHPGLAFRIEFRARSESGRYPWFELRATMMGEGTQAARCLGLMADVTTRKESEAAVVDRTLHDPLTGLGNRVALMEDLERLGAALSAATFALLDIDRFKSIHASLGDEGGDAVLAGIAKRLSKRFSGLAEVFRVGGDGFAVLFAAPAGSPDAVGADLVEACAAPFAYKGRNIFAPASVGVATGAEAEDPLHLLNNAERALAEAKRSGGACARVYSGALAEPPAPDPVALEADLRRALDEEQIDVFYQPIMRLGDGTVAGFEALLRWLHPSRGVIEPGGFVAHSEETGLIAALGRFALERAARDLSEWQRYFPLDPPLFVSVNLSRRQLREPEFCTALEKMLASGTFAPGTLKLEVTESVAGGDDIRGTLTRIRAMGASLAIDDFGTGHSTLGQLRDLPFDTVKIDRSFLTDRSDGGVVLSSMVSLAHELKRDVVAEGVERQSDATWLTELGCEYAQGFYFSPPLPVAGTLEFIARHHRTEPERSSGAAGLGG